ncbi:MAG: hypothetical protein JKY48_03885, partial [Flavobacteriales bacterium]|nr:hypothetical protein [Flavobacteriales bacterium]
MIIKDLKKLFIEYLLESGLSQHYSELISILVFVAAAIVIGLLMDRTARFLLLSIFTRLVKKTKTDWDDLLVENKVFYAFAHLIPVLFIFYVIPQVLDHNIIWVDYLERISQSVIVIVLIVLLFRILNVIKTIIGRLEAFKDKPLDSYFQLTKIVISIILSLLI